jgi:hypothetical protein
MTRVAVAGAKSLPLRTRQEVRPSGETMIVHVSALLAYSGGLAAQLINRLL